MRSAPVTGEHTHGEENSRVGECSSGAVILMGRKSQIHTHPSEIEHLLWHVNSCTSYFTMQGNGYKVVFYMIDWNTNLMVHEQSWLPVVYLDLANLRNNTLILAMIMKHEYLPILSSHNVIIFLLRRMNGPWLLLPSHHRLQVLFPQNTFLHSTWHHFHCFSL